MQVYLKIMMPNSSPEKHTLCIKELAKQYGFDFCGISQAEYLEEEAPRLEHWLNQNLHGSMKYMERNFDKRLNPCLLVPGAKSVISLMLNYFPKENPQKPGAPKISRYAYGSDYHTIIKQKLYSLIQELQDSIGQINGRAFVDSAPVMDKVWAKKSGLGWVGKNTNLIRPGEGSYFFLAEIISDLELIPDSPIKDYCGSCNRCIDACPTDALATPYLLNAQKCISYYTIEIKDALPEEAQQSLAGWAFGCDICQEVCPWNRFSKPHKTNAFNPKNEILALNPEEWTEITEEVFKKIFHDSPIQRTGYHRFIENIHFSSNKKPSA
jgi:epoxyqueuosine reductase